MAPQVPEHLQPLFNENAEHLTAEQQEKFACLLQKYGEAFSKGSHDLGRTNLVKHDIQITDGPPVKQAPRRLAPEKKQDADAQISQACAQGLAEKKQ